MALIMMRSLCLKWLAITLEGNELGASFGMVQLEKLEKNIAIRQDNFTRQCEFFLNHSDYFSNPVELHGCNTAWLAFPILIKKDAPFTRKAFQIYLENRNIQTRVVFTGNILRQPMCKGINKKVTSGRLSQCGQHNGKKRIASTSPWII